MKKKKRLRMVSRILANELGRLIILLTDTGNRREDQCEFRFDHVDHVEFEFEVFVGL